MVRFLAPGGVGGPRWGRLLEAADGTSVPKAKLINSILDESISTTDQVLEVSTVLPPLPVDPAPAIVIMGLNYRSHAAEVGKELPRFPVFAFKNPASVIGHNIPISIPAVAREKPEVDFEAELAIIVGRRVRDASLDEAMAAILGFTGSNDISARRWQGKKGGGQWSRAKSFDTFCPLGPSLIPAREASAALATGGPGLGVRSWVNGQVMQDGNTSDMEFGVAAIVSYLSQGTTLLPGTVILTGTPPGVGYVRKPPQYLSPGDVVEVELEGAGKLTNPVEAGP